MIKTDFLKLRICEELRKRDEKTNTDYYSKITKLLDLASSALERIQIVFSGYTEHGIKHSFNVLKSMDSIIGPCITNITSLELYIVVLCALLHDFGMIVSEQEKREIIEGNKTIYRYGSFERVKEFIADGDESLALQYIIRKEHGERVGEKINEIFKEKGYLLSDSLENPLKELIITICKSHQKSTDYLQERFNKNYQFSETVNGLFIAALLRIGDILDISSSRAPGTFYKLLRITEDSDKRNHWLKNMSIISGEKIESSEFSKRCCSSCRHPIRQIYLYGLSYDEFVSNNGYISVSEYDHIQCEILDYITSIELEVKKCNNLLFVHSDNYHQLYLTNSVKYITHGNYRIPNYRIDMNYDSIVDLLLGKSLYGDSRIGLREILQNSMDACKYKVASLDANELESYNPTIIIEYIKNPVGEYERIDVFDTGIGMDEMVIEKYFLNIGRSLYTSDDYKVSANRFLNAGFYGIGFFASFMLSDTVEVYTRLLGTSVTWHVRIDKNNRYASIEKSDRVVNGTIISLNYSTFANSFPTEDDVAYYIETNFLSDINTQKQITIKIKKDDEIREVLLTSMNEVLRLDTQKRTISLSKYLNGIDCQMSICNEKRARWFKLSMVNNRPVFKECSFQELANYTSITYLKLFFDNSYLFVPPEINNDPFMYNGDRQRSFNLLSERIINEYNYTLKDFLDDNRFDYPSLSEVPPAYIGKFDIYSSNGEVLFFRYNSFINNPEPDGGIILVGETLFDTLYIRNVRIPSCNIVVPHLLCMANNTIIPRITRLIINVLKEGINPVVNRSDIKTEDKKAISQAIGYAIHQYYFDNGYLSISMNSIIKKLYSEPNGFIKQ